MKDKTNTKILFFGSTSDSLIVLQALQKNGYTIAGVITQPPRPVGRKHVITLTPTETWAHQEEITVLSFPSSSSSSFLYDNEDAVIGALEIFKADLLVSASYGQKIPTKTIEDAPLGGINVHPSLLPRWRGADPIPWQIAYGDNQTGATIVTLTEKMDEGKIIAQKKIPLIHTDERESLRKKLFETGTEILIETLPEIIDGTLKGHPQDNAQAISARRLSREDGYIPWTCIQKAISGQQYIEDELPPFFQQFKEMITEQHINAATLCDRAFRAFSPWPGIWTTITLKHDHSSTKRMKIITAHLSSPSAESPLFIVDTVQLEGKTPQPFLQISQHLQ